MRGRLAAYSGQGASAQMSKLNTPCDGKVARYGFRSLEVFEIHILCTVNHRTRILDPASDAHLAEPENSIIAERNKRPNAGECHLSK